MFKILTTTKQNVTKMNRIIDIRFVLMGYLIGILLALCIGVRND